MSDLYLRSVEFSNFRIYGDSYAYELPDGPSVTVITGANGLGKTSFFDGVEWALTNQVSRFLDIPVDRRRKEPNPLTRIGAPENSHRVSLQYSDGAPIDRGAGFVPDEATIARLLKRPEWTEITSLHGYLSITHFLGQASTQRFSLRKPDEQWEALKGPAGVDRINALRERISGLGVRRAFTRAIEDRTKRLEEASNALVVWKNLLVDRDRARKLSSSDEAVPPPTLRAAVETVAARVLRFAPGTSWTMPDSSVSAEALLEYLAALLRTIEQLNIKDAESASMLAKIASAFEDAGRETLAMRNMANDIEARRATSAAQLAEAEATLVQVTARLAVSERQAAQERGRAVALTRVRAAMLQLGDSLARQAETTSQLERSVTETGRVQVRIEALREELARSMAQRAGRRALADRLTLARRRAQVSAQLVAARAEIDRLTPLLAARQPVREIREQRSLLFAQAAEKEDQVARYSADLRQHDDRVQTIAEAVSAIAHRLGHDDKSCPVCMTEFPPGRLVELARAQRAMDTKPASELANALADARLGAEVLRRQIADIDRLVLEIAQLQAEMTKLRGREQELRQQLVEASGSADGVYNDADAILLEKDLAAMDAQLLTTPPPEQIAVRVEEVEAVLKAETAKRVMLQRTRDAAEEEIETARSTLREHAELWVADNRGLLVDLDAEQAGIEARLKDLAQRIATERADVDDARLSRDELRETEARETKARAASNARLDSLATERATLARRWGEAGQSGEPDTGRVAQQRSRVAERAAQIEPMRATQQRLVTGYRKWLNDEQLRKQENQIADIMREENTPTEREFRILLEKRTYDARQELDLAQAARERIDSVGGQMQEWAELYADEVLVPLNATIQRFARTLMTWSDASIIYRAEHHATRSELRPGIIRSETDGSSTQLEMNPNLYFSEGQLSALTVAALFAASTTFGWSRWRGLLLDDPLQHNDVVHASAFMDLLRQMVRKLGYQVILSTHDSAEAEYLGRKCRSVGIPYHIHELIPRGDDGLISNVA